MKAIKAPPGDPVASVGPFERLDEESLRVIAALDKLKTLRTGPRGYLKFEDAHARVWLWPDGDGYEIETR